MKAIDFVNQVLNRTNFEVTPELTETLNQKLSGVDVPDEVEKSLINIISKETALVDKEIAAKHKGKLYDNLTKSQTNALLASGYSQDEISIINNLEFDQRVSKILEINTNKLKAQYSASETEQIALAKKEALAEKERADNYQQRLLSKEEELRQREVSLRNEYSLNGFIDKVRFKADGLPKDKAANLLKSELNSYLHSKGAKVVFESGQPRVVNSDDETEDYYDENSKPVNLDRLLIRLAQSLNIVDKSVVEPKENSKTKTVNFNAGPKTANDAYKKTLNKLLNQR